jgi:hypothetical protein
MPTNQQTDTKAAKIFAAFILILPVLAHVVNIALGHEAHSGLFIGLNIVLFLACVYFAAKGVVDAEDNGGVQMSTIIGGSICSLICIASPFAWYASTIN